MAAAVVIQREEERVFLAVAWIVRNFQIRVSPTGENHDGALAPLRVLVLRIAAYIGEQVGEALVDEQFFRRAVLPCLLGSVVEEREAGCAFFIFVEIALDTGRHENVSGLVIRNCKFLQFKASDRVPVIEGVVREYPAVVMLRGDLVDVSQIGGVYDFISVGTEIQRKIEIGLRAKYLGPRCLVQFFEGFRRFVRPDDLEADGGEGGEEEEDLVADDVAVGVVQVVFLFIERQREDADIVDLREAFGRDFVTIPAIEQRDECAIAEHMHGFPVLTFREFFVTVEIEQREEQVGVSVEVAFVAPFRPRERQKQMVVVARPPEVVAEKSDIQDPRVAVVPLVVPIKREHDIML